MFPQFKHKHYKMSMHCFFVSVHMVLLIGILFDAIQIVT